MGKGLEHADRSLDRKFDPKSPAFFFRNNGSLSLSVIGHSVRINTSRPITRYSTGTWHSSSHLTGMSFTQSRSSLFDFVFFTAWIFYSIDDSLCSLRVLCYFVRRFCSPHRIFISFLLSGQNFERTITVNWNANVRVECELKILHWHMGFDYDIRVTRIFPSSLTLYAAKSQLE